MKASEAHLPMAWIIEGGTPFSASDVAPPARKDCPAVSELKKCRKHLMKKERVGTAPLLINQRGELRGKFSSRTRRYAVKNL